jgi:Flp pilus assembly protein TadD
VSSRDPFRTPPFSPGFDPAQLSFGDVAAVPQLRVEQRSDPSGERADATAVTFREPPVCGESTYDDVEDAGPSWSVRIVQEAEASPGSRTRAAATTRPSAPAPTPMSRQGQTWTAAAASKPTGAPPPAEPTRQAPPRPASSMRTSGTHAVPDATARKAPVSMPKAALDPLKRSTELSPRDPDAAIAYAYALEKLGDASGAIAALDECLSHGGDEVKLICARAYLLGSRLRYDQAEAELRKAAKLRADDPEVQLQTGILACRRARWRDAVEPLQKAAAARSDDALAHFYLGEALNHVDQLQAALAAYEHATKLDPANWRAFKGVGIALDRLGRPADAAVAYRHMREAQGR